MNTLIVIGIFGGGLFILGIAALVASREHKPTI
jgi:hypothetical protein